MLRSTTLLALAVLAPSLALAASLADSVTLLVPTDNKPVGNVSICYGIDSSNSSGIAFVADFTVVYPNGTRNPSGVLSTSCTTTPGVHRTKLCQDTNQTGLYTLEAAVMSTVSVGGNCSEPFTVQNETFSYNWTMISGSAVVPDVRTTTEIFPATGTAAPAATGTSGAGVVGSNSAMGALAAVGAAIFALL